MIVDLTPQQLEKHISDHADGLMAKVDPQVKAECLGYACSSLKIPASLHMPSLPTRRPPGRGR